MMTNYFKCEWDTISSKTPVNFYEKKNHTRIGQLEWWRTVIHRRRHNMKLSKNKTGFTAGAQNSSNTGEYRPFLGARLPAKHYW